VFQPVPAEAEAIRLVLAHERIISQFVCGDNTINETIHIGMLNCLAAFYLLRLAHQSK